MSVQRSQTVRRCVNKQCKEVLKEFELNFCTPCAIDSFSRINSQPDTEPDLFLEPEEEESEEDTLVYEYWNH